MIKDHKCVIVVTAFFRGLSSKRPAVHKPETKVDKDCEIETPSIVLANIFFLIPLFRAARQIMMDMGSCVPILALMQ